MMPIIEFKYHNLQTEFLSPLLDSRLQTIVYALAGFVYFNFGKSLELTEIFRTPEMQDNYYKDNPKYQADPWQSVHEFWRGVDISLRYFTSDEIWAIAEFLKGFIYSSGTDFATGLMHQISEELGFHLHLQVNSGNETILKKC